MEKLKDLSHLFVTVFLSCFANFMVVPAITDVTMFAVCPGKDECSLAIYLSGFQQAIIGLGSMIMMPLIGNLSDKYGRKALLTLPMTLSIIPLVILAYSRTTNFFYAYYAFRTLTAMVSEGSINCLALAYVADSISVRQRASAFGILSGVSSGAFVCGTLAARFLSTAMTFQVAAFVSMVAAVYMRIFLKDSVSNEDSLTRPIMKGESDMNEENSELPNKVIEFKKVPSLWDLICLLKSSVTFLQAAVVVFFNSLAEGGMQAAYLYFLKARFHFNKDQFADLMLLIGIAGTISQLFLLPMLTPVIGEEKLLSLGLFVGCSNMILQSVAWSKWVPYATTLTAVVVVFVTPCLRSIASKQVGPNEQGKAQGCISGVSSFANIVSPLIFSYLTGIRFFFSSLFVRRLIKVTVVETCKLSTYFLGTSSFVLVRRSAIPFPWLQPYVHWTDNDDSLHSECSDKACSFNPKSQSQRQLHRGVALRIRIIYSPIYYRS